MDRVDKLIQIHTCNISTLVEVEQKETKILENLNTTKFKEMAANKINLY